jgi:glycosyltransferase involved in cell wall biosynthesis
VSPSDDGTDFIVTKQRDPARRRAEIVRLSVVMAVFNEEATVAEAIDRVLGIDLGSSELELVIVEGNSDDRTREIVDGFGDDPRVRVIHESEPRGKGRAVRTGLEAVTGDVVLIQDGDLEYRVEDYPVLLGPIATGEASFVLGSRHADGVAMREFERARGVGRLMNFGHYIFTFLFNTVYRTRLKDPFTMYKVFRTECIEGLSFCADRFDFDWELVAKLVRRGHHPVEVPVYYESRGFESGKKVRFFRDPITWIVALVRFRFSKIPAPVDTSVSL